MYVRYLLGGVAALALVGSVTAGRAATHGSKSALHLSMAQKRSISGRLRGPEQLPPRGFHAVDDSPLPRSLTLSALPHKLRSQFPMIRRDDYANTEEPRSPVGKSANAEVVAVIRDWSDAGLGG